MRYILKLTVLLICVFLWVSPVAYTQVPVRLGVDAGINFANQSLSNNPYGDSKTSRLGFLFGGLAEIGIANIWSIQAEPRYIQKGWKVPDAFSITGPSGPEIIGTADLVYKLDYLEIPVLLKAKFGIADFKPFVFGGPNIGFLLSAIGEGAGYDVQSQRRISLDVKDNYKSVDLSVDLGAGAEYQFSQNICLISDARYSLGFNNLNNKSSSSGDAIKSYGIQILAGVLLSM